MLTDLLAARDSLLVPIVRGIAYKLYQLVAIDAMTRLDMSRRESLPHPPGQDKGKYVTILFHTRSTLISLRNLCNLLDGNEEEQKSQSQSQSQ